MSYLAGDSAINPTERGLDIPIGMAFTFHSGAGTVYGDTAIGTLGIFQASACNEIYAGGTSRCISQDLRDLIQPNIMKDIHALHGPEQTRRGMWNQFYCKACVPRVPATLLEPPSHQNFADIRYRLDPRFHFTVSHAIYRGMLQFLYSQYKMGYVVQPLPVDSIDLHLIKDNRIMLS